MQKHYEPMGDSDGKIIAIKNIKQVRERGETLSQFLYSE